MNQRKKSKSRTIMIPDFKTYWRATVTKTVWYQFKSRNTGWGSRIGKQNKPMYLQTIFDKTTLWEKSLIITLCLAKWVFTNRILKLRTYGSVSIKINHKQIQDLYHIRRKRESKGYGRGHDFLNRTPNMTDKLKIDQCDCIKLKRCTTKQTIGVVTFTSSSSVRSLMPRI